MPRRSISGSLSSPSCDLFIDMGHPLLNLTVDGFLRIGTIGAAKAAAEETYNYTKSGSVSKNKLQHSLKKMCQEGALWGSVAGVYVGMEYGVGKIRGTYDWKNAMIAGAVTGGIISAVTDGKKDTIFMNAITGAGVATAVEFLNRLT